MQCTLFRRNLKCLEWRNSKKAILKKRGSTTTSLEVVLVGTMSYILLEIHVTWLKISLLITLLKKQCLKICFWQNGRLISWIPSYYKTIYIYPALKQIFPNALLTCVENNESYQRPNSKWNGILKDSENLKLKKYWQCQLLATIVGRNLT